MLHLLNAHECACRLAVKFKQPAGGDPYLVRTSQPASHIIPRLPLICFAICPAIFGLLPSSYPLVTAQINQRRTTSPQPFSRARVCWCVSSVHLDMVWLGHDIALLGSHGQRVVFFLPPIIRKSFKYGGTLNRFRRGAHA